MPNDNLKIFCSPNANITRLRYIQPKLFFRPPNAGISCFFGLQTMNNLPKCYGIIPARYDSSRFPGKPLQDILGKPMFWHVYSRAAQCPYLEQVVIATDDKRIYEAAKHLNVPVLMTDKNHTCGSERVMEAAEKLQISESSIVINIQGDEPTIKPAMLSELLLPFQSSEINISTLAHEINYEQAQRPDHVKVVLDKKSRALYFSRQPIPYSHTPKDQQIFYGHIGLYAYRLQALKNFVSLEKPSPLENREKLEQLRLLENGQTISVVITKHHIQGVDRPADVEIVTKIMLAENKSP